jgi:uncharacterized protein YggE
MAKETDVWVRIALVVAVIVAIGALAVLAYSISVISRGASANGLTQAVMETSQQQPSQTARINVTGYANVSVTPDMGYVYLTVSTNNSNVNVSVQQNAQASLAVREALYALGLTNQSVQTTSYYVQPVYSYNYTPAGVYGGERVVGYQTSQSFTVTASQTSLVGNIIDSVSAAAGNDVLVNNVAFGLSSQKESAAQGQALSGAIKNAAAKAQVMANATGEQIIRISSVSEQSQQMPIIYPYGLASYGMVQNAKGVPTTVMPQQVIVAETVQVSYVAG